MTECPHCKSSLVESPKPSTGLGKSGDILNLYCHDCDLFYCGNWKRFWFKSFKDSERKGSVIRAQRSRKRKRKSK